MKLLVLVGQIDEKLGALELRTEGVVKVLERARKTLRSDLVNPSERTPQIRRKSYERIDETRQPKE